MSDTNSLVSGWHKDIEIPGEGEEVKELVLLCHDFNNQYNQGLVIPTEYQPHSRGIQTENAWYQQ